MLANRSLQDSLRYQQNKHAQQQYKTIDVLPPEKVSCAGKFTGSVLELHLLQKATSKSVYYFGSSLSGSKVT